jgi:ABC-type phosphate/phosphonate transport system permease subunit
VLSPLSLQGTRFVAARRSPALRRCVCFGEKGLWPQYIAYRNVRMATVIGIVGAGGIGQELKGRYDMYNYGHVGTILVVIFVTVFVLDQVSARIRARYV